jgi:hypothetical protein
MDSFEVNELCLSARYHGIRCNTQRIGDGDDFEYKIVFGNDLEFSDGSAANKFIASICHEYKLGKNDKRRFSWNRVSE